MNKLRSKKIRTQLENRLAQLDTPVISKAEPGGLLPDINDEASRESERSVNGELATRRRNERLRLKNAIGRLAEGTYGICESCDEVINPRRLEVNPTAIFCAVCQRQLEEERRHDLRASA